MPLDYRASSSRVAAKKPLGDREPVATTGLPWQRFSRRSSSQSRSQTSEASASTTTKRSGCPRWATCKTKRAPASGAHSTQESTITPATNDLDSVPTLSSCLTRASRAGTCLATPQGHCARSIGRALVELGFSIRYPLPDHDCGQKKTDVVDVPRGFDQAGLLLDEPPEPAGLPINESSDEFSSSVGRSRMRVRTASDTARILCATIREMHVNFYFKPLWVCQRFR